MKMPSSFVANSNLLLVCLWMAGAVLLASFPITVNADVVLNEKIMYMANQSAVLSMMAYEEEHPDDERAEYQAFGFYDEEPDQAIVAKTVDGYCYAAFRGTTLTWVDWKQNLELGTQDVCATKIGDEQECCTTRTGFYKAFYTHYEGAMEKAVRECAKTCTNKNECVILTGHSQGGAIAAIAGLVFADLNPYVFTFGQPPTIHSPCDVVTSERWFRFVNTKESSNKGISYDPVPFVPGLGADNFGHMIILSKDGSGVAYIGLDAQDYFTPLNIAGFQAHNMRTQDGENPGYYDRLQTLLVNETYPIRNNGWVAGSLCSKNNECESRICAKETKVAYKRCVGDECESDDDCLQLTNARCDSGICLPKLGSCAPCDEDSDCTGNKCNFLHCAEENGSGLMTNNCICHFNQDCKSQRCEGLTPPICEAKLGLGGHCNENSDCQSDYCSWAFVCESEAAKIANAEKAKERGSLVFVIFLAVGLFVLAYFGGTFIRRRFGYEEVPMTMDV